MTKLLSATTLAVGLALSGCATVDRPVEPLTRAETTINTAEENGARQYGAIALDRAKEKLSVANRAAEDGEYEAAVRAAEQAELDAELATAQTNHGKAQASLEEINDSIETLRLEIQRNQ